MSQNVSTGGISFSGLLTVVFITLKLIGFIDWSWWWVFAPLWISALLAIGFFIFFLIVISIMAICSTK